MASLYIRSLTRAATAGARVGGINSALLSVRPWRAAASLPTMLTFRKPSALHCSSSGGGSEHRFMCTATPATLSPAEGAAAATAASFDSSTSWDIFYGSQTGTAHGFSMLLEEELCEHDVTCTVTDLYELDPPESILDHEAIILLMACYGMGEPTDSARAFYDWLMSDEATKHDFSGLKYTVFGMGSSKTHAKYYNVIGRTVDARLQELGAQRVYKRGEGDDSGVIEADFEEWSAGLHDLLSGAKQDAGADTAAATTVGATTTQAPASESETLQLVPSSQFEAFPGGSGPLTTAVMPHPEVPGGTMMAVQDVFNLTPSMPQPLYELRLTPLSQNPAVSYNTGDHVMIFPSNRAERVKAICQAANWDADAVVVPSSDSDAASHRINFQLPITVAGALTHYCDIDGPVPLSMLRVMARHATDAVQAQQLLDLSDRNAYLTVVKYNKLRVADLLEEFPSVNLPFEAFVRTMHQLQPRSYSISSSWEAVGSKYHGALTVTFRHVQEKTPMGEPLLGMCTTWMTQLKRDAQVPCVVRPSTFRLPEDPSVPVICISGGVGIAPFKAFLETRIQSVNDMGVDGMGPCVLFHGCRCPDDEVYMPLLDEAVAHGALSAAHIAYSGLAAPGSTWTGSEFIHERVLQHGEQMWELLQAGAIVYLCGGATGFGQALAQAFRTVANRHGGLGLLGSEQYFNELLESGRYLEDLSD